MQQDGQQHTPPRVIEDPGKDDGKREHAEEEWHQGTTDPNHTWFSPKVAWNEEDGQVPERPEYSQQESTP
ncbi:hypothetical protein KDAU_00930 [Dictyobacter aurantiacus]|uniref:Uncharacterized protein n=1 Tax=Dictyobacter aurantiacus TaxID=1936993 RepID=A0A401Z7E8_9CHLR|nr:hypothetical protein KDAU_00930 [Dictyobacter aurantiacus]